MHVCVGLGGEGRYSSAGEPHQQTDWAAARGWTGMQVSVEGGAFPTQCGRLAPPAPYQ